MKHLLRHSLIASLAGLCAHTAFADVKMPAIFSDHMVLQSEVPTVPVWGWADPGEEITVTFAGQSKTTKAGADGKWRVDLAGLKTAGTAQTLTVKGKNSVTIQDVLVGEVWLASGQSNMGFTVDRGQNAKGEIAAAKHPQLRMYTVARNPQRTPQTDAPGKWEVCTPETVGKFSAVAYFFGRELNQKLTVPIGMINSSVGGTDIAAWTSEEVQGKIPALKEQIATWEKKEATYDAAAAKATYEKAKTAHTAKAAAAKAAGKKAPTAPRAPQDPKIDVNRHANLYNGMIAPILPYAIKGAIWYQGEHNSGNIEQGMLYRTQLSLLIDDWRARWGYDFPFASVQLPGFLNTGPGRAVVREAFLLSLRKKNTGMAVAIDIGDPNDNHPKNKQEVGRRLSLWSLNQVYGQKNVVYSGPLPAGSKVEGSAVAVSFEHTEEGLVAKGGDLKGFEIAGADKQWKPAQARIDGKRVIVSNPDVKQPLAVRYAWAPSPECNLYNGASLPATPFRTEEWN